jgi:sec-independent protein translocase protein TatA
MLDSPVDWIILIVVVLIVLGGSKKIPELARSVGRAFGEFKKGRMEVEKEIKEAMEQTNQEQKTTVQNTTQQ